MIDTFLTGQWSVHSMLICQKDSLLADQFTYWIGWFENPPSTLLMDDFISVSATAGYTVVSSPYYFGGPYFASSPGFQPTEELARADAWTAINAMTTGFAALGY